MICSALGGNAVSKNTCKRWYRKFWTENFNLSDEHRSGAPKKVEDEKLDQLLQESPCQT